MRTATRQKPTNILSEHPITSSTLFAACRAAALLILLLVTGCTVSLDPEELLQPPRIMTQTVQAQRLTEVAATVEPTRSVALVPTLTPVSAEILRPEISINKRLTVWINETSPEHVAAMRDIGERFTEQESIQVEFVFVDRRNVVGLARSAQLTEQLPDLIMHDLEQTAGLLELGILDVAAADAVVGQLSAESFTDGALSAQPLVNNTIPAIPIDGWQYLVLYRKDWFADAGLSAPNSYDALLAAATTFDTISFDPPTDDEATDPNATPTPPPPLVSGLVVPTEQDSPGTQRVFEWLATANGCQLTNTAGEIIFEQPACLEALEFYRSLVNDYGPPDFQTDTTALKAFADGRTAMAILPPSSLAYFASVADAGFTQNVGIATEMRGFADYGTTTSFSNITYLGIVNEAAEGANAFAQFMLDDAYGDWLAVEPERKVPLRESGAQDWRALWRTLPVAGLDTIDALYPEQGGSPTSDMLANNLTQFERWGFGTGRELLAAKLYENLTIAPVLTRMLNGYIGSYQAILDANEVIFEAAATESISDS